MFVWKHRAKTTNASWNASRRGGSTEIAGDLLNAVSVDPPRRDAFHDAFVVFARCFQTNKRGRRRSHR